MITGFILVAISTIVLADKLNIPNTFVSGTPAKSSEVNANFSAIENAVDTSYRASGKLATNTDDVISKQAVMK